MKRTLLLFFLLIGLSQIVLSQIVSITPSSPSSNDSIQLIYNAQYGNKALEGYNGDVYIYTGLITTTSTDSHDWKHIVSGWSAHSAKTRMQHIGTDLYKISFKISTFYDINPDSVKVLKLAMLFQSADNALVGRNADGSDIFYTVNLSSNGDFESYDTKDGTLNVYSQQGKLIIKPFTPSDIKVSFLPDSISPPDTSYTVVLNPNVVPFSIQNENQYLKLSTSDLEVVIKKYPIRLHFVYKGDTLLSEDEGIYNQFGNEGLGLKASPDEAYYGTGSRSLPINRRGYQLEMYNQAHYGYDSGAINLNIAIPVVVSSKGYLIYFDNHSPGTLNLDADNSGVLNYESETGSLSYFFMTGANNDSLLSQYTKLTGRQPLPPMWSLGYIQSKYGYKNASEAQTVVNQMKTFGIPLDAIVLDLYWFGSAGNMGNLDWDNSRFPNPTTMMSNFAAQGVKTILITEPYFTTQSTSFSNLDNEKMFALNSSGNTYILNGFWAGSAALLDLTKPHSFDWMWSRYQELTRQGVGGWWCDLGEPEDQPSDMVNYAGTAREIHNIYSLTWAADLKKGFTEHFPNTRLFNLIRSGYAGMQRYSTFPWSGDTQRTWPSLHGQIPLILGMGMSGIGYMHTDIGGFTGNGQNDELYTRWMQFGAFTPIMRAHGVGVPTEPYNYPDPYRSIVKKFIQLRYDLLPYNYTLSWENHLTGRPLAMPLNYFEPNNPLLENISDEYFWGKNLLIAPVTTSGATSRRIYVPNGKWFNFWNNESINGNQEININAPLDQMPILVKAGSFIPMSINISNTETYHGDSLQINYYPDLSVPESNYTLYNDDGKTPGTWENGAYQLIRFNGKVSENQIEITLNSLGNGYVNMPTSRNLFFNIKRIFSLPSSIKLNGKTVPVSSTQSNYKNLSEAAFWDENNNELKIHFPYTGKTAQLTISNPALGIPTQAKQAKFTLLNPIPQPFIKNVRIPINVAIPGNYILKIYNLEGKLSYARQKMITQPGENEFYWNGQSSSGRSLPAGVYIIVVSDSNGHIAHTKLIKISGD